MRTTIFCATVAFSCCGLNSLFGQIHIAEDLPNLTPQRSAAGQGEDALGGDLQAPLANVEAEIPDPFQSNLFFDDEQPAQPATPENTLGKDPSSLPAVKEPRTRDLVDTIVDYSTLASTPNASHGPVQWGAAPRTPNPVAEILLRQQCVEGLWDGYAAQRAAECIAMRQKLAGHGCPCGGHVSAGPCQACTTGPVFSRQPRNRYREPLLRGHAAHASTQACDANCDAVAPMVEPTQMPAIPASAAPVSPAAKEEPSNVASALPPIVR